jgi:hypothetical protein
MENKKTLTFDCNSVLVETKAQNYFNVEIETTFPDEILNEFEPEEVIENYENLDKLYEALKEHYGED